MKKIAYDVLMGILPVMIGVYLGIYFNNKNAENKQEQLQKNILESLYQETQRNTAVLKTSVEYFAMLRDSTDQQIRDGRPYKQFAFWKGLNPPQLNSTAFDVAHITNVLPDFPFDLVQHLSTTYSAIEDLESQSQTYFNSVTDRIGDPNFYDGYAALLFNYAYDMVSSEEQLLLLTKELEMKIEQARK